MLRVRPDSGVRPHVKAPLSQTVSGESTSEALAKQAHEAANLTTALLGGLELVSLAASSGRSVEPPLDTARRAAERIGELVRRIEAGLRAGHGPTQTS